MVQPLTPTPAPHSFRKTHISSTVASQAQAGVPIKRYEGMVQDEHGVWTAPSGDRVAWFADPDGNVLSVTATAS